MTPHVEETSDRALNQLTWKTIIFKHGLIGAIAVYGILKMTGPVESNSKMAADGIVELRMELKNHNDQMAPLLVGMQTLVNLSLQTCANQADDVVKRSRCFQSVYVTPTQTRNP